MAALTSQKAYLYETCKSTLGRENQNLDYKLEGHHAKLEARDSLSVRGKYALSIGKKLDLKREKTIDKKVETYCKSEPVIMPECRREDTEVFEDERLKRENTGDITLTRAELLENENISKQRSKFCSACATLSSKGEKINKVNNSKYFNSCKLCMKQENISSGNSKEDKTLLMSMVYPHDFYDQYQSVRKSNNFAEDSDKKREKKKKIFRQKTILPKATFTLPEVVNEGDKVILKPHVVKLKEQNKEENDAKSKEKCAEPEIQPSHNFRPLVSVTSNQQKHFRCQPRMKAYFLAALTPKTVVKDKNSYFDPESSFKGLLLTKSDNFQKSKPVDVKHSFYNVGSLGLTIGIPEYNSKIRSRQNFTNNYLSRAFTSLSDLNRPQTMLPPLKCKVRPPGSIGHKSM